jgi:2-C-methyl-D-erythritol 4-phosphate cytidylyltransferase
MTISVIIPVAGRGVRFGGPIPKQYLNLNDLPIISLTIEKFVSLAAINFGVVVAAREEIENIRCLLSEIEGFSEKFQIVAGGNERQDSVYQGLKSIPSETDVVIVHDGVRPLVTAEMIHTSIQTASEFGACVMAVPVKETIKRVADQQVLETIPRNELWQIQTPQTFKYQILMDAHERAKKANFYSTDESALVEWCGYPVRVIMGAYSNIKITTEDDLAIARIFEQEGKK